MPTFLVRIQLHKEDDYPLFYSAMAKRGFVRTVTSDAGIVRDLPTGMYVREAPIPIGAVLTSAQRAAAEVRREAKIIVAEATSLMWSGLDEHDLELKGLLEIVHRAAVR
jgi:hypothetical protein